MQSNNRNIKTNMNKKLKMTTEISQGADVHFIWSRKYRIVNKRKQIHILYISQTGKNTVKR